MLFMVVERFRNQDAKAIYRRLRDKGRMMPEGLSFVGSWVSADDVTLLQRWVAEWSELIEFEIVPVVPGQATGAALSS